jgi:diaminopimelate epimerase
MTSFYKLSGGGNDFLALVEPEVEPSPKSIRAWCARGVSVGADGLFTLARRESGARMIHYNADGGRAELCLNGTRCAARLAFHLGWAADELVIETDSGEIDAGDAGSQVVKLELEPPRAAPLAMTLDVEGRATDGWRLRVGGPHFVIAWEEGLARAPLESLGPPLRSHPDLGAEGANVHFVDFAEPGRFGIRSWERGVEAETLACGSGVLASAAVGLATGRVELPVTALTRGGFELEVDGALEDGRLTLWSLAGDARLIAQGSFFPGSEALPTPPRW